MEAMIADLHTSSDGREDVFEEQSSESLSETAHTSRLLDELSPQRCEVLAPPEDDAVPTSAECSFTKSQHTTNTSGSELPQLSPVSLQLPIKHANCIPASPSLSPSASFARSPCHEAHESVVAQQAPSTESEQGSVLAPLPSDASDGFMNSTITATDSESSYERPNCEQTPLWKLDKASKTPRAFQPPARAVTDDDFVQNTARGSPLSERRPWNDHFTAPPDFFQAAFQKINEAATEQSGRSSSSRARLVQTPLSKLDKANKTPLSKLDKPNDDIDTAKHATAHKEVASDARCRQKKRVETHLESPLGRLAYSSSSIFPGGVPANTRSSSRARPQNTKHGGRAAVR